MSQGRKLHRLLEFMVALHSLEIQSKNRPVVKKVAIITNYTYERLLGAFKKGWFRKSMTIDDITFLCSKFIFDGLASNWVEEFGNKIGT
jgi:hypothetical protein